MTAGPSGAAPCSGSQAPTLIRGHCPAARNQSARCKGRVPAGTRNSKNHRNAGKAASRDSLREHDAGHRYSSAAGMMFLDGERQALAEGRGSPPLYQTGDEARTEAELRLGRSGLGTLSRGADLVRRVQGACPAAWLTGSGCQSGPSVTVTSGS